MKSISIVSEAFYKEYENAFDFGCLKLYDYQPLRIAYLKTLENPLFDERNPLNDNLVLVKVKAFSLNFRDKALCLQVASALYYNASMEHWPIGSEFSGVVEKTGRKSCSFKTGR